MKGRRRAAAAVILAAVATTVAGCLGSSDEKPHRRDGPGAAADEPVHRIPGRQLVRGDWETGDLSQWDGAQAVSRDRIQVVTSPVDQGDYAGRFEVRDGDNPIGYGDRAEVQVDTAEREGADRWYAWSTMFDPTYPTSDAWQVVSQWHCDCDGTPSVGFYVIRDRLALQVNPHDAEERPIREPRVVWSTPLDRGTWHRIRLHVIWSGSDQDGLVDLWHDGEHVAGPIHIRTLYPGHGAYFKQGLYRQSGESRTGIVYHDAFRASEVTPPD